MLKLGWFMMSKSLLFNPINQLPTFVDCMDSISAAAYPAAVGGLVFGTYYFRDPLDDETSEELLTRGTVTNPAGETKVLWEEGPHLSAQAGARHVLAVNIVFTHPGIYWFGLERKVDGDWREEARLPLVVKLLNVVLPPESAPAQEPAPTGD